VAAGRVVGGLVVVMVVEVIDSRGSERRRERLPITRAGSPWESPEWLSTGGRLKRVREL
jgi:hypothetical protein